MVSHSLTTNPVNTLPFRFPCRTTRSPSFVATPCRTDPSRTTTGLPFLHDELAVGAIVNLRAPQGQFHIDPDASTDLVLIAGGVGITPMVAMINDLQHRQATRNVFLFYVVRNGSQHPFKNHLHTMATQWPRLKMFVFYTRPRATERLGVDYSRAGRLRAQQVVRTVGRGRPVEFYICGPTSLMHDMTDGLRESGIPLQQIHVEAFGPPVRRREVSLVDSATTTVTHVAGTANANSLDEQRFTVTFDYSKKCVPWSASYGSLLELAEAAGIPVEAGCRAGHCGTCMTALRQGSVSYVMEPSQTPEAGKCLLCVAQPASHVSLDA
jgi:uncharacterized protein